MDDALPAFRYHPDPIATGSVVASDATCACCGQARGFVYAPPVHGAQAIEGALCPWCIADGSAARELGASFADPYGLAQAGVALDVIDEIESRTPSYTSWQQEEWLSHCGDACEFHGDAPLEDVLHAGAETKAAWRAANQLTDEHWLDITRDYRPGGNPAFYKFVCRHCGCVQLGWDCS